MQISNMGRTAVFFGQPQPKNAKQEASTTARRSAIMAPEQIRGSVSLNISEKAQRALLQLQEERLTQAKERKTGHIKCEDPYVILGGTDSDLKLMETRNNLDSESMATWRDGWRDVATRWGFQASETMLDFYGQLQRTLGPSHEFRADFNNMISLANRFSELRQNLLDKHENGELTDEELEAKMSELDEAFGFAAEVLSRRAEHREAVHERDNQISRLQSMRRLMNISGAMRVELACGATIVFLGDSDEPDLNTERVFQSDSHIPKELLEAIRESTRHFTELTRNFVQENGQVRTPQDIEWLEDVLRSAPPPFENGFTFDELLERDAERERLV